MGEWIRRFLIDTRKRFTGEADLYQAEKIVKRLSRERADYELDRAARLLRRYRRGLVQRFTAISALILIAILVVLGAMIAHVAGRRGTVPPSSSPAPAGSAAAETGAAETIAAETLAAEAEPETEEQTERTVLLSFTGDCTIGTDEKFDQSKSFNAYYNANGGSYFLRNVRETFSKDDLTVINMEGTLTTSTDRADKTYAFKGDPSYVDVLTTSFVEAANMANNHSSDYGEESYRDTVRILEENGIVTFGYDEIKVVEAGGVRIGLTGIYELRDHQERADQVKANIAKLKEQGAEVIVAVFHWGIEKETRPNENQRVLAHLAIDEGADIVIGHHPHVLQGVETYKGKTIAYSLGNFCFGGNSNPSDKDTMILQAEFTLTGSSVTGCDIEMIPCSISSESSANTYQPTILTGSEADRVLKKIADLSEGLGSDE